MDFTVIFFAFVIGMGFIYNQFKDHVPYYLKEVFQFGMLALCISGVCLLPALIN